MADFGGQLCQLVIGEDEPAQARGQGRAGQRANLVGLEAHHFQRGALPQHGGHFGKPVIGAEQHAQPVQARQVGGQGRQGVAREVEDFERVGQIEDFAGKLSEAGG